jgi:hypothetical protein
MTPPIAADVPPTLSEEELAVVNEEAERISTPLVLYALAWLVVNADPEVHHR